MALTAVSIGEVGEDQLSSLGKFGAKKVLNIKESRLDHFDSGAYTKALVQAAESENADVIIISYNYSGKAIAPRLSVRLKAGIVPGSSCLTGYSKWLYSKKGSVLR